MKGPEERAGGFLSHLRRPSDAVRRTPRSPGRGRPRGRAWTSVASSAVRCFTAAWRHSQDWLGQRRQFLCFSGGRVLHLSQEPETGTCQNHYESMKNHAFLLQKRLFRRKLDCRLARLTLLGLSTDEAAQISDLEAEPSGREDGWGCTSRTSPSANLAPALPCCITIVCWGPCF